MIPSIIPRKKNWKQKINEKVRFQSHTDCVVSKQQTIQIHINYEHIKCNEGLVIGKEIMLERNEEEK